MKLSKAEKQLISETRDLKANPHCPNCRGQGRWPDASECEYSGDKPVWRPCTYCGKTGRMPADILAGFERAARLSQRAYAKAKAAHKAWLETL